MTETALHEAVAELFAVALPPEVVAFHIRNERASGRITAARMGILPGVCDWELVHEGRATFIELKPEGWMRKHRTDTGWRKLTVHEERQIEVQQRLRRAGCYVLICETLDEVIAACRAAGVPMRVS